MPRTSVLILALSWTLTTPLLGQIQTRGHAPARQALQLGPVAGWTTDWHPAPQRTAVPLGASLRFKALGNGAGHARWTGATVISRVTNRSIATVEPTGPGTHVVQVTFGPDDEVTESIVLDVVDMSGVEVTVSPVHVEAPPVTVDPDDPNASSMAHFFADDSLATVRTIGSGHYATSTRRWLTVTAEVHPAGFAPLVEWREGDRALALGARDLRAMAPRRYAIEIGPPDRASMLTLESYVVFIDGPAPGSAPVGTPITYSARTHPAGYEDDVQWLASTKYGTCAPQAGQGATFTTTFDDVAGAEGIWLGVKADHATREDDRKGATPWNRMIEAVSVVPSADGGAMQDVLAFFSIRAEAVEEPIDLSTEVSFFVNGELAETQQFDLVAHPPTAPPFGCFCDPFEMCLVVAGVPVGCVDRWLGCDPIRLPLELDDVLSVEIRSALAAQEDEETGDDRVGLMFEGRPALATVQTSCAGQTSGRDELTLTCNVPPAP